MAQTRDALRILANVTGNNKAVDAGIAQAKINFEAAQLIYDARTEAGLSQSELANLIGSKQPVIARLEDADYKGHTLAMLQRIAAALQQRLELRLVPQNHQPASTLAAIRHGMQHSEHGESIPIEKPKKNLRKKHAFSR